MQKLYSFGLLNGSFRPDQQIRTLRSLMRLPDNLVVLIFRKRSDHGRLGLALLLCFLRYPGMVLSAEEVPPVNLMSFVARQLGISPRTFAKYSQRDQTRREQLAELLEWLHYRAFDRASFRRYLAWLTPIAQNRPKAGLSG